MMTVCELAPEIGYTYSRTIIYCARALGELYSQKMNEQ